MLAGSVVIVDGNKTTPAQIYEFKGSNFGDTFSIITNGKYANQDIHGVPNEGVTSFDSDCVCRQCTVETMLGYLQTPLISNQWKKTETNNSISMMKTLKLGSIKFILPVATSTAPLLGAVPVPRTVNEALMEGGLFLPPKKTTEVHRGDVKLYNELIDYLEGEGAGFTRIGACGVGEYSQLLVYFMKTKNPGHTEIFMLTRSYHCNCSRADDGEQPS